MSGFITPRKDANFFKKYATKIPSTSSYKKALTQQTRFNSLTKEDSSLKKQSKIQNKNTLSNKNKSSSTKLSYERNDTFINKLKSLDNAQESNNKIIKKLQFGSNEPKLLQKGQNKRNKQRKGIKLVKNISSQPQQHHQSLYKRYTFSVEDKQNSYSQHFYHYYHAKITINGYITLYNFGIILKQQGLIRDLVKDRHIARKIWYQINNNQIKQNVEEIKVFSVLLAILLRPSYQINIFAQKLLQRQALLINQESAFETYKYFYGKFPELRINKIARPLKRLAHDQ